MGFMEAELSSEEEKPVVKESSKGHGGAQDISRETIEMITREAYKVMMDIQGSRRRKKHRLVDEDPEERDVLLVSLSFFGEKLLNEFEGTEPSNLPRCLRYHTR
jgi:hypothetical protein